MPLWKVKMKLQLNDNLKAILLVVGICIAFYLLIFTTWNLTSSEENRPSSFLWDGSKDGYKRDPLYDRKK